MPRDQTTPHASDTSGPSSRPLPHPLKHLGHQNRHQPVAKAPSLPEHLPNPLNCSNKPSHKASRTPRAQKRPRRTKKSKHGSPSPTRSTTPASKWTDGGCRRLPPPPRPEWRPFPAPALFLRSLECRVYKARRGQDLAIRWGRHWRGGWLVRWVLSLIPAHERAESRPDDLRDSTCHLSRRQRGLSRLLPPRGLCQTFRQQMHPRPRVPPARLVSLVTGKRSSEVGFAPFSKPIAVVADLCTLRNRKAGNETRLCADTDSGHPCSVVHRLYIAHSLRAIKTI